MTETQKNAWIRSGLQAIGTGALTFFTMLPQTDDWTLLASAVGVAVFTILLGRGLAEGQVDVNNPIQRRADETKAA